MIPDEEIEEMRNRDFRAAAEKHPVPPRFTVERAQDNLVLITDTDSGRMTACYLFNLGMVLGLLGDLFGDEP